MGVTTQRARQPKVTKSSSLALFAWLEPGQAFFICTAPPAFNFSPSRRLCPDWRSRVEGFPRKTLSSR